MKYHTIMISKYEHHIMMVRTTEQGQSYSFGSGSFVLLLSLAEWQMINDMKRSVSSQMEL